MYFARFPSQESFLEVMVEQLVTGRDGSVRSARVSVLSNNSKKLF